MSSLNNFVPYSYNKNTGVIECSYHHLIPYDYYIETGCVKYNNLSITSNSVQGIVFKSTAKRLETHGELEILTHLIKYCKDNMTQYNTEVLNACNRRLLEIKTIQQYSSKELDNIFPTVLSLLIVNFMH